MSLHQTTAAAFPRLYRTAAVAATDPKSWANKHIEAPNAKQLSSRCKCARWTKLNCEIRLGFNFHPKSLENKTVSPKTFPKTAPSYLQKRCQLCWSVQNSAAAKVIVFIRGQTVQSKVMTVLSATHHWKEEKEETSTDTLTFSQTDRDRQSDKLHQQGHHHHHHHHSKLSWDYYCTRGSSVKCRQRLTVITRLWLQKRKRQKWAKNVPKKQW